MLDGELTKDRIGEVPITRDWRVDAIPPEVHARQGVVVGYSDGCKKSLQKIKQVCVVVFNLVVLPRWIQQRFVIDWRREQEDPVCCEILAEID